MKRILLTFIAILGYCSVALYTAMAEPFGENLQSNAATPLKPQTALPREYVEILVLGLEFDLSLERRPVPELRESVEQVSGLRLIKSNALRYIVKRGYPMERKESQLTKIRLFTKSELVDTLSIHLFGYHEELRSGPRTAVLFSPAAEADTFEIVFAGEVVHRGKVSSYPMTCDAPHSSTVSECEGNRKVLRMSSQSDGRCNPHDGDPLFDVRLDPDCEAEPVLLCSNGRLNLGEQGVDCGGVCPHSCL